MTKSDISDDIAYNPYRSTITKSLSSQWPRLPTIEKQQLKSYVATHSSIPLSDIDSRYRYERLAFVGEGMLFSFVTSLIQDLFPGIDRESASIFRSKLLSPPVLSSISIYYSLPSKAIISRHILEATRNSIKATSEMFEAYLGGLFYSYEKHFREEMIDPALTRNTERIYKSSVGEEQGEDTKDEKKNKKRKLSNNTFQNSQESQSHSYVNYCSAQSYAYDQIQPFLLPIFTSLAKELYDPNECEHKKLLGLSENSKGELHILLGKNKLPMPIYAQDKVLPSDESSNEGGAGSSNGSHKVGRSKRGLKWKVSCIIVLPEQDIFIREEGMASNSKDAGNIAAYLALKKLREIMLDQGKKGEEKGGEGHMRVTH
ncbi:hypothetical protein V865_004582 [Kwoniella europaea PYCC6329]|uniref:RNase III domain-containing protein n=1 Tax=Kwoniella europaea PYCC6329 TaxID=1423913 RepID=A0AAX4KJJ1_9TREE